MQLAQVVNTFGRAMQRRHGCKVHKLPIDAGFTCPNLDGTRGRGGCSFCNNRSFSPHRRRDPIALQLATGAHIAQRLTHARRYLAYFQAYTNTYASVDRLASLYDEALAHPDVIGLSIGTRPDCAPDEVLDLLGAYQGRGHEVWLELGLQSASDDSLRRVNRGHGFAEYCDAVRRARRRGLQVCTHLIVGLPGEHPDDSLVSLRRVLDQGVDGIKIHPLHVVRGTRLAGQWRSGEYQPLTLEEYAQVAAEMVRRCPPELVFHRLTGTARKPLLLAPDWCTGKWAVLNRITQLLQAHAHG